MRLKSYQCLVMILYSTSGVYSIESVKHHRQAKISEIAVTIAKALASTQLSSNADVLTESIYQVLQSNEDKTIT